MYLTRKGFLWMGGLLTCVLASLHWRVFTKSEKRETFKFLTHDGKLVEVDGKYVPKKKITASKQQLVSWIWKEQKL